MLCTLVRCSPSGAAALLLCSIAGTASAYTLVEANGGGFVSPDNGQNRVDMAVTRQAQGAGESASGLKRLRVGPIGGGPIAGADLSGSAYAAPGVLKARIDGSTFIAPFADNIPTVTHGAPIADGSFSSRFVDTVNLTSSTLAVGTPVQFNFTVNMHVVTNRPGHNGPDASGWDSGNFYFHYFLGSGIDTMYRFPNGLYKSVPSFEFSLPMTVSGLVGDTLTLGAELSVGADARAGWYLDRGGFLTTYGTNQETHIDASNTARLYLDAITPGLELVAESGHDYAISAVPEPGTWALLGGGLCVLAVARRRASAPRR
ncbi:PEP-CTERM sorting domain-containing protein [Aquincola tertiaricarbonis]|uniref:PEP-CTERM sorting domain-containing protein n=1 Tax=Aquincola tertiaricarbonis TaxID=391953 RepID=UPI0009FA714C|nr:PEP-CTERM sorting domain-containing protein [Aquincola tertiaricarbonis]